MFPFAIVNEFGSKIEKLFLRYANRLNKIIFEELKKRYITDELRLDSDPILEILENLKKKHGEWIEQDVLKQEIEKNLDLIDDWSRKKLNESLEKQREVLRQEGVSEKEIERRVPLIPKESAKKTIPLASERIQLVQNEAYRKHFEKVRDIINDGIILGKNAEEITEEILKATDMDAKRARFWAEDQLALFHAEQRRVQMLRAGHTHYRWVSSKQNVRPSHAIHDGKIYSWSVGVNNLTRPGARHPGEDYRCHCVAMPLSEEEKKDLNLTPESPRLPESTSELVKNYQGKEEERVSKGEKFIEELRGKPSGITIKTFVGKVLNSVGIKNKLHAQFVEAKTLKEANELAKRMGIIVDYKDLSLANDLNLMLTEVFNEEGFAFPRIEFNESISHPAQWNPAKGA
ncbi:MAG: phage minor head protein [Leptospiraceae bacterium]|nr:phage minor head protein [Leptospiraceae bacterium]